VVETSGLPWTTLRATQFYDLCLVVSRAMGRLPVVPVPVGFRFQPVDTDEVAARLVELASGPPSGVVAELGGPRIYRMTELVQAYLDAAGLQRRLVTVPVPGRAARAIRGGAIVAPAGDRGRVSWEEFLARELAKP